MISNNLKYPKINNNKSLIDEISRQSKLNNKIIIKSPIIINDQNDKIPISPYSSVLKSPSMKIPKTPNKTLATSPYRKEKCLLSPKPSRSPFNIKSPYKPSSPYPTKKDPWVYTSTINERFTKIIGIDEYGNICKIPTVDYQLPQTVRYISEDNDGSDECILIGDIFLDQKNSKGRDYNFVSENMRNISLQTNNLRSLYANKFRPFDKNIKGRVTLEEYEELLEIYENNQVYYQDCIQNGSLTYDQLCEAITELEYWFICIIEPYDYENYDADDYEDWKTREQFKINKGYSGYCDPELYFYIKQPLSQDVINYIKISHKNLFRC